jgi:hypothetical protein
MIFDIGLGSACQKDFGAMRSEFFGHGRADGAAGAKYDGMLFFEH